MANARLRNTELRRFTRQEVATRNTRENAAIIINNLVYDITEFLDHHPGGADALLYVAGLDASVNFYEVAHSGDALVVRREFVVGEVVEEDYRLPIWQHWLERVGLEPEEEPEPTSRVGTGLLHHSSRLILTGVLFLGSVLFLAALYENIFRNLELFKFLKYKNTK